MDFLCHDFWEVLGQQLVRLQNSEVFGRSERRTLNNVLNAMKKHSVECLDFFRKTNAQTNEIFIG